jgi:phosphate-selective porin OprO/OprP
MTPHPGVVLTLAVLACLPQAAWAQTAAPIVGFEDGFVLQTPDGQNRLGLGLAVQADGRLSIDAPAPLGSTFTIRKMRPTLTGRVARYFDFKVMPDFGNGTTIIQDAYLDVNLSPAFRVRAGKDKTPVGYELLIGDAFLLFPERSLASSLVPNRDVGFQVQGDLDDRRWSYAAGIFNGIPDGATATTDVDADRGKDVAMRVAVRPFRDAGGPAGTLRGLGFQIGSSYGREESALPSFRTSVGQNWFFYDPAATADGLRRRVTPSVFYYYKGFGGFAEYMRSTQVVARAGTRTSVANQAWEVTGSLALTRENASDRGIHPHRPLDPPSGNWGAWQLVARYASLAVDRAAFEQGLAGPAASRRARQCTAGINWYPAAVVKYYANVERTSFPEAADSRPVENVFIVRAQLAF